MGHITNPVGFRVGRTVDWSSNWSSDKFFYANSWIIDISLKRYFEYLFKKLQILSYKKGFIFSHVDVYLLSNVYFVKIYIYNATIRLFLRGRLYYYWRRISIFKEKFMQRLQKTYLRNFFGISFSKILSISLLTKLNKKLYSDKKYINYKLFDLRRQKLYDYLKVYKKGIFGNMKAKSLFINNIFMYKRYFFFKGDAKFNRKKQLMYSKVLSAKKGKI